MAWETSGVSKTKTASCSVTKTWWRSSPTDSGSKRRALLDEAARLLERAFAQRHDHDYLSCLICALGSERAEQIGEFGEDARARSANRHGSAVRQLYDQYRPAAYAFVLGSADTEASQLVARD